MKKKKIVSIIGARPQFIKVAPLSRKLRKIYNEVLIHTGQHYDKNMSNLFFNELKIPKPDYNLGVGSGLHGEQTGTMLIELEKILINEKPDLVLVYGDTNSTIAGSLAAVKLHIPIAHIEAGLRSYNKNMPEEHNRIVTDHLSDILFVPSHTGMDNLKKEGLAKKSYFVGDIMYDALLHNVKIAEKQSTITEKLQLIKKNYYVLTVHRPSNTDNKENLVNILKALMSLDMLTIFPVHPRTKKVIQQYNLRFDRTKIKLIQPLGYLDILKLTQHADKIFTDSGGLQKEAFYLRKPTIVLRSETEWIELLKNGWTKLVGSDYNKIVKYGKQKFLGKKITYPYGKGHSADKIVKILQSIIN